MEPAKGGLCSALGLRGGGDHCAPPELSSPTSPGRRRELQDPPQQYGCPWGPQLGRPACGPGTDLADCVWLSRLSAVATSVRKVPCPQVVLRLLQHCCPDTREPRSRSQERERPWSAESKQSVCRPRTQPGAQPGAQAKVKPATTMTTTKTATRPGLPEARPGEALPPRWFPWTLLVYSASARGHASGRLPPGPWSPSSFTGRASGQTCRSTPPILLQGAGGP